MISVVFEEPRNEVFEETFPQSHWARVTKVLPDRRNKGPPKQRSFNTLVVLIFSHVHHQKTTKRKLKIGCFVNPWIPFEKGPGIKLPSRWLIEVCG